MLNNLNNYYVYAQLVQNGTMMIDSSSINMATWQDHYNGILNILKDGIELENVHHMLINICFTKYNNFTVPLYITDYYFNIIMWKAVLSIPNSELKPKHIVFLKETTGDKIKEYIDKFLVEPYSHTTDITKLNNIIADTLYNFHDIDEFSYYLGNTLNLEDDIVLAEANKEYDDLLHCDLSGVPIDRRKDAGIKINDKAIHDCIIPSKKFIGFNHCLVSPFRSGEGINARQHKEFKFDIGTKPDGQGSIFHDTIDSSYIGKRGHAGLDTALNIYIDNAASRVAQIISKKNVGESGGFARILGLNNMNCYLNPDPDYDCGTKNFEHIFIPDKGIFKLLIDRYYRMEPEGIERKIHKEDTFLIGKYIYLRSPMCCESYVQGHGFCRKCYGDLYHVNKNINVGRIASEIITSQYTQKRLSAKHLLETMIDEIFWTDGFYDLFEIDVNMIKLNHELFEKNKSMDGWELKLNIDSIELENDDDFLEHKFFSAGQKDEVDGDSSFYNEYVTEFYVTANGGLPNNFVQYSEDGNELLMSSKTEDGIIGETKLYLSNEFSKIIREKLQKHEIDDDNNIYIPFNEIQDSVLFLTKIENNDLGKSLDKFNDLINKKPVTKNFNRHEILEHLQEVVLSGGIHTMSVHLEVIMANQIRSSYDKLKSPDWSVRNAPYEILTLNEALTDNPSVTISLMYQKLQKALFYPSTYTKTKASIFDVFFMRKPKKFLTVDHEIHAKVNERKIRDGECPIAFVHNPKEKGHDYLVNINKELEKFDKREKTELED